nr:hypothetical protein [uncultured Dialister sp.]
MKVDDLLAVIDHRDQDIHVHFYFGINVGGIWKRDNVPDILCQGHDDIVRILTEEPARLQKYMDVFHMWLEASNDSDNGDDFPVLWVGVSRKPILETTGEN